MFTEISNEEAIRRLPISEEQRTEFFRLVQQIEEEKKTLTAGPTVAILDEVRSVDSAYPTAKDPELECEEPRP